MKIVFTFSLICVFRICLAQLPPEADPHRGMYVNQFVNFKINSSTLEPAFSILSVDTNNDGIFEVEDAWLNYACENHITYLALYDLNKIIGRNRFAWNENSGKYENLEKHLCRFITKAKSQYGVTQIGAIGESESFFDSLETFMARYPVTGSSICTDCEADIDVLNVEYEFWGDCFNELPQFISVIQRMHELKEDFNSIHPQNPLSTEAYVAFIFVCTNPGVSNVVQIMDGCTNCSPWPGLANPHPRLVDRILYTMTVVHPANVSFGDQNQYENPQSFDSTDFHPMFYSEMQKTAGLYDFMGEWLSAAPQNTIFIAEAYYYYHWKTNSNAAFGQPRMNNVQPGGVHWFAGTHMVGVLDHPEMVQTPGAFCTTDSARITINCYGPDEAGTNYELYISRDSDQSVVYPQQGGKFSGVSKWIVNNPALHSINFLDTIDFPPLYLPPGKYTAKLKLMYNGGNGCTYECDYPVTVASKPVLQITGDTVFCNGSHAFISAPAGATNYTWYRNGSYYWQTTVNQLKIVESGNYHCFVNGGSCQSYTDTVSFKVHPIPNIDLHATCNGNGTLTLRTDLLPVQSGGYEHGQGGIIYRWNTGETTDHITVNVPNTRINYFVSVTEPYSGCNTFRRILLKDQLYTNYTGTISVVHQPSDSCSSNGVLTASLSPVVGAYDPVTYLWSNGATTATIYGVSAGTYSVSMTVYKNGCSFYATINVGTPPIHKPVLNETVTDAACDNSANGSITLNPAGGNQLLNFHWTNVPVINGYHPDSMNQHSLLPGIYNLTVTDTFGCKFNYNFSVGQNSTPIVVTPNNVVAVTQCGSYRNGSATIHITGGTSPYSRLWEGNGITATTGDSLYSGSYRVTVTDNAGCSGFGYVHVPNDIEPLTSHLLDSSKVKTSCYNTQDGSLYVCIHGGEQPYSVSPPWAISSINCSLQNLSPGMYPLSVTDDNGCVLTDSFLISTSDLLLSITAEHTTCIGCTDGKVHITITGGQLPHSISWLPSSGILNGNSIEQLPPGNYNVCVTDSFLCQTCLSIDVLEDPLDVNRIHVENQFRVFPNPNNGKWYIQIKGNIDEIFYYKLFNAFGAVVYNSQLSSNTLSEISTANLDDGIYFLSLYNSGNVMVNKKTVVIQN